MEAFHTAVIEFFTVLEEIDCYDSAGKHYPKAIATPVSKAAQSFKKLFVDPTTKDEKFKTKFQAFYSDSIEMITDPTLDITDYMKWLQSTTTKVECNSHININIGSYFTKAVSVAKSVANSTDSKDTPAFSLPEKFVLGILCIFRSMASTRDIHGQIDCRVEAMQEKLDLATESLEIIPRSADTDPSGTVNPGMPAIPDGIGGILTMLQSMASKSGIQIPDIDTSQPMTQSTGLDFVNQFASTHPAFGDALNSDVGQEVVTGLLDAFSENGEDGKPDVQKLMGVGMNLFNSFMQNNQTTSTD